MSIAFFSTHVYTNNPDMPHAQALLARGNAIAAVGSNEQIENQCLEDTRKIHLNGGFICPGFVDFHCHLWSFGYNRTMVNLRGLTSLDHCLETIEKAAQKAEPGQWIVGCDWNQNLWEEAREPDRHDLDQVTPRNPAVMVRVCGHSSWVNSFALELANITKDTPEPAGGHIDREPGSLQPSGIIRERVDLIDDIIPPLPMEEKVQIFLRTQEAFLSQGITCAHCFDFLPDYKVVHEVQKQGKLRLRVCHSVHPEEQDDFDAWEKEHSSRTDMLWHDHIKIYADGSLGAASAFLHEPYENDPDNCGIACMTKDQMAVTIERAYATGRNVIIHAIGDGAVTRSLDAVEQARKIFPGPHRDRIEHLQLVRIQDLQRMKDLGIGACVQPLFVLSDWQTAHNLWGEKRCQSAYAWKTMKDLGLHLMFSSDAPIESNSPLEGIQAAVTRRGLRGNPPHVSWHQDQCLPLEHALKAYFSENGWATGREEDFGSIVPGKRADLTVLARDPFAVPPEEIADIPVSMTLVNGAIVFQKGTPSV